MSIIVPVLNEEDNVVELLNRIKKALGKQYTYEIIIVDGGSKDKTVEKIHEFSAKHPEMNITTTTKVAGGIIGAVQKGISASKGSIIIVMDGDLQHPPEAVPDLIKQLNTADLVMASRYPGRIKQWSIGRKLASMWAAEVTRLLYRPARKTHDPLSGFFAVWRDKIQPEQWGKIGGFKVSLLVLRDVDRACGKIIDVHYEFKPRKRGHSKMRLSTILSWAIMLGALSWEYAILRRLHGTS